MPRRLRFVSGCFTRVNPQDTFPEERETANRLLHNFLHNATRIARNSSEKASTTNETSV